MKNPRKTPLEFPMYIAKRPAGRNKNSGNRRTNSFMRAKLLDREVREVVSPDLGYCRTATKLDK
jgi:hypothetical protein